MYYTNSNKFSNIIYALFFCFFCSIDILFLVNPPQPLLWCFPSCMVSSSHFCGAFCQNVLFHSISFDFNKFYFTRVARTHKEIYAIVKHGEIDLKFGVAKIQAKKKRANSRGILDSANLFCMRSGYTCSFYYVRTMKE